MRKLHWAVCAAALLSLPAMAGGDHHGMKKEGKGGSGTQGQAPAQGELKDKASPEVKQALQKRTRDYEQAFNKHDVEKMASFYTPDATLMLGDGQVATGSAEIKKAIEQEHRGPMKNAKATFTTTVRELTPTVALLDVKQHVTGAQAEGGQPMPTDFHVTVVTRKVGAEWKVEAVRAMPDPKAAMGVGGSGSMGTEPDTEME